MHVNDDITDGAVYHHYLTQDVPPLLDVLDFRHGDAELLSTILLQNEIRIQEHRGSILVGAEQQCIRRMAKMAREMEAKQE